MIVLDGVCSGFVTDIPHIGFFLPPCRLSAFNGTLYREGNEVPM